MARSCFHTQLFANPVKLSWCITRLVGPLGALIRIGWLPNWCQWPSQSMLWFMYIPVICWGHSTTVCGLMAGRARLQLAHPPPSPAHPLPLTYPLISAIRDITGVVKSYLNNQQWIMHGRVSYKTVAISLLYLYSKSCMAIMQHRRITAASMLQNGISRNTKCDTRVGFPKSGHICFTLTTRNSEINTIIFHKIMLILIFWDMWLYSPCGK